LLRGTTLIARKEMFPAAQNALTGEPGNGYWSSPLRPAQRADRRVQPQALRLRCAGLTPVLPTRWRMAYYSCHSLSKNEPCPNATTRFL